MSNYIKNILMEYTFDITQDLIDSTERRWVKGTEPSLETFIDDDPIERAIGEILGKSSFQIHSDGKRLITWPEDSFTQIYIPITYNRALDFIKRWRTNKSVKPFIYKLNL